ncbi:MAG: hypothetical protein V4651_09060 [Bacteroidota bacterium]
MATLTINRAHQFINRLRNYRVLVNGQEMIQLGYNEQKTLTLSAGTYIIRAKVDWVCSEEYIISLGDQDVQTLEIGCSITINNYQKILSILGFGVLLGSILMYETITPIALGLLLAIWVVRDVVLTKGKSFLYYLSTGRSKYLYIKPLRISVSH